MEMLAQQTEFAHPGLKQVIAAAQVKTNHNWIRSVFLEVLAWSTVLILTPILFGLGSLLSVSVVFLGDIWVTIVAYLLCLFISYGLTVHIVASVFYRLKRLARRFRINDLADLRKDGRDPVLYLRSFYVDTDKNDELLDLKTDEEALTLALREIGPVIALGNPSNDRDVKGNEVIAEDRLPQGATRIYFGNKDWQEGVCHLMELSRFVVICAGTSAGLLWEIKAAVKYAGPSKVLISFLSWQSLRSSTRNAHYRIFRDRAEKIFQELAQNGAPTPTENFKLPETLGNASFFFFGENWKVTPVSIGKFRRLLYFLSRPTLLRETLRAELNERGVEPRKWKSNIYCFFAMYLFEAPPLGAPPLWSMASGTTRVILYILWIPAIIIFFFVMGSALRNLLAYWFLRRREITCLRILPEV